MKELNCISKVNPAQIAFGAKLGLNLHQCTVSVAAARIYDAIDREFWGLELGTPTPKQVDLASKFGYAIANTTRREGNAVIDDLMTQLNLETIDSESLSPGVVVTNIHDPFGEQFVISSIKQDGTVYFRGGNGRRAWARSLRAVKRALVSDGEPAQPQACTG